MAKEPVTENQIEIKLHELSESLGFTKRTIKWVYGGIGSLTDRKKQQVQNGESNHVAAKDVCIALMRDIRSTCKDPIRDVLSDLKIESSKDIGRIVYGLIDKELINANEDDSIKDFDDLFTPNSLDEFLANNALQGKVFDIRLWYRHIMWSFYSIGTIIVLGSYLGYVEPTIAWSGWSLAMVGFLMQFYKPTKPKRF